METGLRAKEEDDNDDDSRCGEEYLPGATTSRRRSDRIRYHLCTTAAATALYTDTETDTDEKNSAMLDKSDDGRSRYVGGSRYVPRHFINRNRLHCAWNRLLYACCSRDSVCVVDWPKSCVVLSIVILR